MKPFALLLCALFLLAVSIETTAQSLAKNIAVNTLPASRNDKQELVVAFDKNDNPGLINPPYISAVLNDDTDPARTIGIRLSVTTNGQALAPADYTIRAESNNETVVPKDSILFTKSNGSATFTLHPSAVGYADIEVKVFASGQSKTVAVSCAVSVNNKGTLRTYWHTGICDASNGADLGDRYFVTGDDEQNALFVYNKYQSGGPVASFVYGGYLALPDCEGSLCSEVDVEALAKSPAVAGRIYWLGSMSNGKAPKAKDRPNRNRIFATDFATTGVPANPQFAGYYADLKKYLIKWGDAAGYHFSKAAAPGQDCKSPEGFAAEGMVFGPDNKTLYIGMRAPLVPVSVRNKAVLVPVLHFEQWFGKGSPTTPPTFGAPIEIDLGGRGIRDIIRLSNGTYVIAAGNSGHGNNTLLYKWTGNPAQPPVPLPQFAAKDLNIEGLVEVKANGKTALNSIQAICDDGKEIYYDDATAAKDLDKPQFKKFKSVVLVAGENVF